ncbi:hypothetical protein [Polyangium sp. 6x1]|uniref:hypothetical protein n=1 Tax=Polyangium sp. 6x1 TaxID=3042689 RepID=UPI00248233C1|nr:hypothetical protein [Polyangium sp. 6x1]MDI1444071.1 hypothetical protein [Polyangium sp. 6x1]
MEVSELRLVHVVSRGSPGEPVKAFAEGLRARSTAHEITLIDGREALSGVDVTGAPTVLLNADRAEVMELLARSSLVAVIEKYALFAWWKHRGRRKGAFWIHGLAGVARGLGPDIMESPLYRTDSHCAFGSEESAGLPDLLARYLEGLARKT